MVLNFDETFFQYYNKTVRRDVCPNVLYVACTRATDLLIIVAESCDQDRFKFLVRPTTLEWTNVVDVIYKAPKNHRVEKSTVPPIKATVTVTDLLSHVSGTTLFMALSELEFKETHPGSIAIDVPTQVASKLVANGQEDVSSFNGSLLEPLMRLYFLHDEHHVRRMVNSVRQALGEPFSNDIKDSQTMTMLCEDFHTHLNTATWDEHIDIDKLMRLIIMKTTLNTKILTRYAQLSTFAWFTRDHVTKIMDIISTVVVDIKRVELEVEYKVDFHHGYELVGKVDVKTGDHLYELKCTTSLTDVHKAQLLCYAFLYMGQRDYNPSTTFSLLNVLTGQTLTLVTTDHAIVTRAVDILWNAKGEQPRIMDDSMFVMHSKRLSDGSCITADMLKGNIDTNILDP